MNIDSKYILEMTNKIDNMRCCGNCYHAKNQDYETYCGQSDCRVNSYDVCSLWEFDKILYGQRLKG
jgi:hypothetical protein